MMLDLVKKSLRVSSTAFDDEIQSLMDAAKLELNRCGIYFNEPDDLVKQAIVQFCKSRFGFDNKEAERFEEIFYKTASALSLSGDYNVKMDE